MSGHDHPRHSLTNRPLAGSGVLQHRPAKHKWPSRRRCADGVEPRRLAANCCSAYADCHYIDRVGPGMLATCSPRPATRHLSRRTLPARSSLGHRTVEEVVFQRIRDEIITGRMKPHERLTYRELAQDLGVSVTPIRIALRGSRRKASWTCAPTQRGWLPHSPRSTSRRMVTFTWESRDGLVVPAPNF